MHVSDDLGGGLHEPADPRMHIQPHGAERAGNHSSIDYPNVLTVDSTETSPEQDTNTVKVQPPPPNWKIDVFVSPFALGGDGDGNGGKADFGNQSMVSQGDNTIISNESLWFQILATNVGGSTATGVSISSTLGPLPYGQNDPTSAVCDATANDACANGPEVHLPLQGRCKHCRHNPEHRDPPLASNAVPAGRSNVATRSCDELRQPKSPDPELIGLEKGPRADRLDRRRLHGGRLTFWNGKTGDTFVTQSQDGFQCVPTATPMTIA